jgi:voltage-gated potassium channel Kch
MPAGVIETRQPSAYRLKGLLVFAPICVAAFGLGVWGFMAVGPASSCHAESLNKAVFHTLLLIARSGGGSCTSPNLQLIIAQIALPLLLALGTVFAAVRIIIDNLRHDAQLALVHAMRGHAVVCGMGETGLEAARQLVRKRGKAVAVSLDPTGAVAQSCKAFGVPLITGDATLHNALAAAGISHARAAIICTGSDALNLEICLAIDAMPRHANADLRLFPEIRGGWFNNALAERQTAIVRPGLQLHPFKTEEVTARMLLRRPAFSAVAAAPRLMFIGFDELASAILHRAIVCNYALPGLRLSALCMHAPLPGAGSPNAAHWAGAADIDWVAHECGMDEAADEQALEAALDAFRPEIVVITLRDDAAGLRVANQLRKLLDHHASPATAIFVHIRKDTRLCAVLAQMTALAFCPDRIAGFGDLGEVVSPEALFDENLDVLAQAMHETYLTHASGDSPARVGWAVLAERYRRDNRAAADHIPVKLADAGYVLRPEPGAPAPLEPAALERMAAAEHHRWSLSLRLAGWKAGEERNEFRKTHPLLVPWEALPKTVRDENQQQIATIPDSLKRAGLRVLRTSLAAGDAAPGDAEMPVFELDITGEAGWARAEAALQAKPGLVLLHRPQEMRAERLRTLARQYPNTAAAMAGWLPSPLPEAVPK